MQRLAPADTPEVAAMVREAAATGQCFEIMSRGTKRNLGRPVNASAVLDVSALSGVLDYKPEELVLSARAATPLTEIQHLLASRNQMLGFEPAEWGAVFGEHAGRQTLAGVISADVCGPRGVRSGNARDHVIGCRFVNGSGEVIRAGGPVIKNVTGFDVPKLMCGAFGTLGVLTEITVRVLPRPIRIAALLLRDCAPDAGLRALIRAAQLPAEPTGLAYLPAGLLPELTEGDDGARGVALIRIEGTAGAIDEKIVLLNSEFRHMECTVADDAKTELLFRRIGELSLFALDADLWRLCVPPASADIAINEAGAVGWFADWCGGVIWLQLPATVEIAGRLRAITARLTGHATLFRAGESARAKISVFEPEPPVRRRLTEQVKLAFDPHHLFNPGRMFEYA